MANIRRETIGEGIFLLTFDRPDSVVNTFDFDTLSELESQIDAITSPDQNAQGLIFTTAKPAIFVAGADLFAVRKMNVEEMKTFVQRGQSIFTKIASLPFPTVAAVHGAALGGGYELCLACDWRVASSSDATKVGLPETKLGIIPAWGGCTRLPRLLGVPKALDVILAGQIMSARQALHEGLVDEVVPREHLVLAAKEWLAKGKHEATLSHSAPVNAVVDAVIAPKARHEVQAKTHGNFPAVEKALDVILRGSASWDLADSLEREREAVAELIGSDTTRQLMNLFFAQEHAKKFAVPDAPAETAPIKRAAVIGAGVMGSGIAQWLSTRGVPVILRDLDANRVAAGMGNIAGLYASGVRARIFTELEARQGKDLVSPAPTEVPLRRVDLIVEAASENMQVKKTIFQRLDELADPGAVLATNTSALSITELAASTKDPSRVVGLHFFNPVHKMQLVEVIMGSQTSPAVAQRAVRFAQKIGKLPVLVKDSPGFLVNRILVPYLVEAGILFWNGAEVKEIDGAMREFGLPMGPLRLIDEIGADVALEVCATLATAFPNRLHVPDVLPAMQGTGLLGRKEGKGFYKYRKGADASPNKEAVKLRPPGHPKAPSRAEIEQRLSLLIINEAARCLEERIVGSAAEIDLAMVMGTGFPPFRGGPLRYADSLAIVKVAEELARFAESAGPHYSPCGLLRDMAKSGKRFYED